MYVVDNLNVNLYMEGGCLQVLLVKDLQIVNGESGVIDNKTKLELNVQESIATEVCLPAGIAKRFAGCLRLSFTVGARHRQVEQN